MGHTEHLAVSEWIFTSNYLYQQDFSYIFIAAQTSCACCVASLSRENKQLPQKLAISRDPGMIQVCPFPILVFCNPVLLPHTC